ncbi:MAG: thioredoxin [Nitrososphaeria archaeon]|nr:thioredoxin [Nitrososphaeria archaeon]
MENNEIEKILSRKYLDMIKRSSKEEKSEKKVLYYLDSNNFDKFLNENANVIVDFFAEWCGPCKMMAPIFEQIAREYSPSIMFAKLNVDQSPDIAERFIIMGVPTIIYFKSGKAVEKIVGAVNKNILKQKIKEVYGL